MKAGCFFVLVIASLISLPAWSQDLSINILKFTNASKNDKARVTAALELLGKVVNSSDFRQKLVSMDYPLRGEVHAGYTQTTLSVDEVLESIISAEENFSGGPKGSIDLFMDMYYESCAPGECVIGYTSLTDPFLHMNRFVQMDFTPAQTAGNIFHEWLHKIGHGHSYDNNEERPHSVPYKLGYLMATMSAELAANGDPLREELFKKDFLEMLHQNCSHRAFLLRDI